MELFLFWFVGAVVVGIIANARGRSGFGYAALSLILSPVIAVVLVLALPNLVMKSSTGETITQYSHVRCPDCRELVRRDAVKCKHCGSALTPTPLEPTPAPKPPPSPASSTRVVDRGDGKWTVGKFEFDSEEAAQLFAASRR